MLNTHYVLTGQWRYIPYIPALGKQKQVISVIFEASLIYRVSPRTVNATERNPVLKIQKKKRKKPLYYEHEKDVAPKNSQKQWLEAIA